MEAFGRIHPSHRNYDQWYQVSKKERRLHLVDMAESYITTAEKYHHDAIFVHPNPGPISDVPTDSDPANHPRAVCRVCPAVSEGGSGLLLANEYASVKHTDGNVMPILDMIMKEVRRAFCEGVLGIGMYSPHQTVHIPVLVWSDMSCLTAFGGKMGSVNNS